MKPRSLVLLLACASLAAKLYCAATTIGTSDVAFFFEFGKSIQTKGLIGMYQETSFFNHTPLVGWFVKMAYAMAASDDGSLHRRIFAFFVKLPAIFSDVGAVVALLWIKEKTGRPAWWALALFAASPVAFMVSGYHGNVDSVVAFALLLAAAACVGERAALCGLAFGVACNVKIVPLMFAPIFFFYWWKRRRSVAFTSAASATLLAGWCVPLLLVPNVFLKNVFGYGSVWGVWGITYFLRISGIESLGKIAMLEPTPQQYAVILTLKVIVVASVLAIAWRRRGVEPVKIFETLALAWAVFFVFAPGFGTQYLVWPMPFFLIASESWFAVLTITSSVAAFVFYNSISHGMPWWTGFTVHSIADVWAPWLILPWLALVAFLFLPKHLALAWRADAPVLASASES